MVHKTLFLFLGLLVLVGLIYWGSLRASKDQTTGPSFGAAVDSGKKLASFSIGQVLGTETLKNTLSGFTANSEQAFKNGAANLIQGVADGVKNRISGAFQTTSTPDASSPDQIEGVSQGTVGVCPKYKNGETVGYVIKFFSPATGQIYSVDWGDGQIFEGNINASSQEASVSHAYKNIGDYTVTFKLPGLGSSGTQKEICIR